MKLVIRMDLENYGQFKCTNCGNVFTTNGHMEDEFVDHAYNCFDIMDFFKIIKEHGKGGIDNGK